MRRIRFILFAISCVFSFSAFGQLKTVSVPQVVNRTSVSYNTTMRIHQTLLRAVGGKHGYMVYDRADGVDAVLNEHSFQRSGLVSASTMQKLGAATGAQFVLYSEVVRENSQIYLYVQFLDVQSMRVVMSFDLKQPYSDGGIDELCKDVDMRIRGGGDIKASAVRIYDYLTVFPRDLGEFKTEPTPIIAAINRAYTEGYNGWRLPTSEELSMMRAAAYEIPNFSPKRYMTSDVTDYDVPVAVRLVTTEASAATVAANQAKAESLRKPAILQLLGVSESQGLLDMENKIFVSNRDVEVVYYENKVNIVKTSFSGGWRYPSYYELRGIDKSLSHSVRYVYDHNVETKFVDRATHKVYYMLVYYKGGSR
ncbi:MAG: hypothetical protein J6Q35_00405, partial [Rikenellaceae bacterium]|nr:hypothetical protein [Rikenellaceae bacterium]